METITLGKKQYVVVEKKKFEALQVKTAKKADTQRKFSLEEGRKRSHQLIASWEKEK